MCQSVYSLLKVLLIAGELEPIAKLWATFRDIGDGVFASGCMTVVGVKALAGLICLMRPKSRSRGTWD